MDLGKIGAFVQTKRKENNLTQVELAERLGVSDRAVSKWENGACLPDADNMVELCRVLGITINDLLAGEVLDAANDSRVSEALVDLVKQKQQADKRLLTAEVVIGALCCLLLLGAVLIAAYFSIPDWLRVIIIVAGFVILIVGVAFCLRIEQKAGYYRCAKCGHTYVPEMKPIIWSMHMGRTRYMKCPCCGKYSWQKKVISQETDEK